MTWKAIFIPSLAVFAILVFAGMRIWNEVQPVVTVPPAPVTTTPKPAKPTKKPVKKPVQKPKPPPTCWQFEWRWGKGEWRKVECPPGLPA